MNTLFRCKPDDVQGLVSLGAVQDDAVELLFSPLILMVPETHQQKLEPDLYIAVGGTMDFQSLDGRTLRTSHFSTQFGYFRKDADGKLEHAYGGHFDFEPNLFAHPIAHMQLTSQDEYWPIIREYYKGAPNEDGFNWLQRMPHRVRVPTAQMDVFAILVQIAADHLVNTKSEKSSREKFQRMAQLCAPFSGYEVPSTAEPAKCQCRRGAHFFAGQSLDYLRKDGTPA